MKSIRLSLMVYFLLLLVAALGAVSYFYYRGMAEALRAEEKSTRELLQTRYKNECHSLRAKFDKQLLSQAQHLAGQACAYRRSWEHTYPADLIAVAATPGMRLSAGLWVPDGTHTFPNLALTKRIYNRPFSPHPFVHLEAAEVLLEDLREPETKVFFQTFTKDGWPLEKSASLEAGAFQLSEQVRRDLKLFKETFDDVTLPSGLQVRCVTLHVTVPRFSFAYAPGTNAPNKSFPWLKPFQPKGGFSKNMEARQPKERATLKIFIQYAGDVQKRDRDIANLRDGLAQDQANLAQESQAALDNLWFTLLGVNLGTFAALMVGGFVLVWLGLVPLKRLSLAVSRVSARDFRLEIDNQKMPRELKPIVERLKQTLELLHRAFAREKQAAADISHELRTPLAAIMTTLEVALRKPRSADEYREMMEDCRESGRQMNQLVERLLKLARLDAGADMVRPREVDVASLADQCASLVRPLVEVRGLTMSVRHEGPALLMADPDKIREVITNLLHNAIQYNRPNGAIDVWIGTQNDEMHIEVSDTGIGISEEARVRIFERFYRTDPSRHAEGLHAGLGLAIVKGYVDLMGGGIEVESKVGEGTLFRVCLPVRPAVTRVLNLSGTATPNFAMQPAQPGV